MASRSGYSLLQFGVFYYRGNSDAAWRAPLREKGLDEGVDLWSENRTSVARRLEGWSRVYGSPKQWNEIVYQVHVEES